MASSEDDVISGEIRRTVANAIGKDWKKLGRQLNIDDSTLDGIQIDNSGSGIAEMAYQTIRKWKDAAKERPTLRNLQRHLQNIGYNEIARKIGKTDSTSETEPLLPRPAQKGFVMQIKDRTRILHVLKKVQENLKQTYATLRMTGMPWMDELVLTLEEYYVEMSMVITNGNTKSGSSAPIPIKDIFLASTGRKKPIRILIEGRPGFGKSTVAAKLVYDWAKMKPYTQRFHLAYLIPLRNFQNNLTQLISTKSDVTERDQEYLMDILHDKSKHILLVLDGYDELSFKTEHQLLPLFNKQEYPHLTLVITSRPGEFTANKKGSAGSTSLFSNEDISPTFSHFLDKKLKLKGMNSTQRNQFFNKHTTNYPKKSVSDLRQKLDTMVDRKFLKCPLFYLMLIVVFRSDDGLGNIRTQSDFYKRVMNFVLGRYCKKTKLPFSSNADLFSFDKNAAQRPECVQLMTEFGKFAFDALKMDKLSFSQDDILKSKDRDCRILQLGLLTKSISINGPLEVVQYEPVHKTLLEFAAAYSLWATYTSNVRIASSKASPRQEWENKVCSIRPNNSSSLVFPFLTGLMEMEAKNIVFEAIEQYAADYCKSFSFFELSLREMKTTTAVLDSLLPFMPVEWISTYHNWVHGFYKSPEYNAIITHGTRKGKIKLLDWTYQSARSIQAFPDNTEVENVRILLSEVALAEQSSNDDAILPRIKCKELYFIFLMSSRDSEMCTKMWTSFLKYLEYFDYHCISFRLSSYVVSQFLSLICSATLTGKLKDSRIKLISCDVNEELNTLGQEITKLLRVERVEALEIHLPAQLITPSQQQLAPMFPLATRFTHLTKFCLWDTIEVPRLNVDLFKLCDGGHKSWECLELGNVIVQCPEQIVNTFEVRYLAMCSVVFADSPSNFFQSCIVSSLSCSNSVLTGLNSDWPLTTSVTELKIPLDVFLHTNKFSNLQILALNLASLPKGSTSVRVEELMLGSHSSLYLKGLEIWGLEKQWNFALEFVKAAIRCLTGVACDDAVSTSQHVHESDLAAEPDNPKTMKLQYFLLGADEGTEPVEYDHKRKLDTYESFRSLLNLFVWPLEHKCLPQLHIVCHNYFFENVLNFAFKKSTWWAYLFSPEKGFTVRHDLYGTRDTDSIRSQLEYTRSLDGGANRFRASAFGKSRNVPNIPMLSQEYEFIGRTDNSLRHQIEFERSLAGGQHRFLVSFADS